MRLLLLSLNYAPEPVGIAVYSAGLARSLAAMGHDVTVIAGQPYYPHWRRMSGSTRGWRRSREDGVTVIRCPLYIPLVPTGARRIVHLASFAAAALPIALREAWRAPDAVMAVAPALLAAPIASLAARLARLRTGGRTRFWLHFQDFEIDAAGATGLVSEGRLLKAARSIERRLLERADRVSTISKQMIKSLADKNVPEARLYELRNWANDDIRWPDDLGAAAHHRYCQQWGLPGRRIALYSGNIANKQGLEIVIEAAHLLRGRRDIGFVICGQGPNRARLEALAKDLDNVVFDDLQPQARMGELLMTADVHLLPQLAGAADLVLPSKLTNMLASGRPVVATAAAATGLAEEVEGAGIVTPPGDAAAMADAIVRIIDDSGLAGRLGTLARARAQERWSRSAIIARFEREMQHLIG